MAFHFAFGWLFVINGVIYAADLLAIREWRMCSRIEPHTTVHHGTGHVLHDNVSLAELKDAMLDKHGWQARLVRMTDTIKQRLERGEAPTAVRIDIDPDEPRSLTNAIPLANRPMRPLTSPHRKSRPAAFRAARIRQ